uniref:Nuclear receptor domain-containing protein n=1 Tax=Rhabditophanes sp. KR3021 TaxID=114890 RepID=A0AC35U841_9BILA
MVSFIADKSLDKCRVCGDFPARMHYSVPTCYGCKGFFRRTLKRPKEYVCRYQGNCIVDRHERNSCRFCRFRRCIEVGMDPKAVRPDRDNSSKIGHLKLRKNIKNHVSCGETSGTEDDMFHSPKYFGKEDWLNGMSPDIKTLIVQLTQAEKWVCHGDTLDNGLCIYPIQFSSIRHILEDPTFLDGKRTEMNYNPYQQAGNQELKSIAHRHLISTIDWVEQLSLIMEMHNISDKLALIKSAYAPLSIFSFSVATAKKASDKNILCMCNFGYVPRLSEYSYEEPYYLANKIVERAIDELVEPFRNFNLADEESTLMKAIIVLNHQVRGLSHESAEMIADLRDRVQEALFHTVKAIHPEGVASSRFGNLLLFLPTIVMLGNVMNKNLHFLESFGKHASDPLMHDLLENLDSLALQEKGNLSMEEIMGMTRRKGQTEEELTLKPSCSSSSLLSINSQYSDSSYNTAPNLSLNNSTSSMTDYQYQMSENGDRYNINGSNVIVDATNKSISNASLDCDPNYNVTLTQNMVSGMGIMIKSSSHGSQNIPNNNCTVRSNQDCNGRSNQDCNVPRNTQECNVPRNNQECNIVNSGMASQNGCYPDSNKPMFYIDTGAIPYNNDCSSPITPNSQIQCQQANGYQFQVPKPKYSKFTVTRSAMISEDPFGVCQQIPQAYRNGGMSYDGYEDQPSASSYDQSYMLGRNNQMTQNNSFTNNSYYDNTSEDISQNQATLTKSQSFHNYSYQPNVPQRQHPSNPNGMVKPPNIPLPNNNNNINPNPLRQPQYSHTNLNQQFMLDNTNQHFVTAMEFD